MDRRAKHLKMVFLIPGVGGITEAEIQAACPPDLGLELPDWPELAA
jgi:hypothetical protein